MATALDLTKLSQFSQLWSFSTRAGRCRTPHLQSGRLPNNMINVSSFFYECLNLQKDLRKVFFLRSFRAKLWSFNYQQTGSEYYSPEDDYNMGEATLAFSGARAPW